MESLDLSLAFDREHLQQLLISSLRQLCHSKVSFKRTLSIEGLLGLTVDDTTVQLISIKELLHSTAALSDSPSGNTETDSACPRSSRSRRKSVITRRAIVSSENECGADMNKDWNIESTDDGLESDPYGAPLNLVKNENSDLQQLSGRVDENESTLSATPVTEWKSRNEESESLLNMSSRSEAAYSSGWHSKVHTKLRPSSSIIRKYGSYGYMINHGSDVMFSCNQCPKMFRNRVSLWRHGVKHKMSQNAVTSKALPSHIWLSTLGDVACTQAQSIEQQFCASVSKESSLPVGLTNSFLTFQRNHAKPVRFASQPHEDTDTGKEEFETVTRSDGDLSSFEHVNGDIKRKPSEMNGNHSESVTEKSSNSSSSVNDESVDLSARISQNTGSNAQSLSASMNTACEAGNDKASEVASAECERTVKLAKGAVNTNLLPVISSEESNPRLISGYGYVVDTANGKLYKCISCLRSFKNRVSLWKHQMKHQ